MAWKRGARYLIAIVTLMLMSSIPVLAQNTPLARHKGLVATAEPGFDCGKPSSIAVTSPDEAAFEGDKIALNVLLTAARSNLTANCPGGKVPDLIVRGLVSGREVYRGAMNAGTQWILVDVATAPPAQTSQPTIPPPTATPAVSLIGSWQGTFEEPRSGPASSLPPSPALGGALNAKVSLTDRGGIIEFKNFLARCIYAVEPVTNNGPDRKLTIADMALGGCNLDGKFFAKASGTTLDVTLSFADGSKLGGKLKLSLGPPQVTTAQMPAIPLETAGFSMAMTVGLLQNKVSEIYGSQSANTPQATETGGNSFLGFADKNQAFVPRRHRDENHIREILTFGSSMTFKDLRAEPTWLMRIWAPMADEAPTAKATLDSVIKKYGQPSLKQHYDGRGYHSDDMLLEWHFNPFGKQIFGLEAEACRYKQDDAGAYLSLTRGWKMEVSRLSTGLGNTAIKPSCGYSILSIVDADDAGRLRELTVSFYDQTRILFAAWENFSLKIGALAQAVLQSRSRSESNEPKL